MYRNESEVGSTILAFLSSKANTSSLKREDIHFTTKLASNSSYETARKSIKQSVKQCGLGYIDLFLLHSPYGGKVARLASWKAVEDAIADGEVKTGGVSNFGVKHVCGHRFLSARRTLTLSSFKSFWHPSLECSLPSTRLRCILSTRVPKSHRSARSTISSSKLMRLWCELYA